MDHLVGEYAYDLVFGSFATSHDMSEREVDLFTRVGSSGVRYTVHLPEDQRYRMDTSRHI